MNVPVAAKVREPTLHPSAERLRAFGEGRACKTERIVIEAHLFHCTACTLVVGAVRPPPDPAWSDEAAPAPRASRSAGFERLWERIERREQFRWPREAAVLPPTVLAELEPAESWSFTHLWPSGTRFTVLVREPSAGTELYLAYYGKGSAFPMHYHVEPEDNVILAGGYQAGSVHVLAGDWVIGERGTRHSPRTDADEECWCLSQVKVGTSKLETFHGTFQGWLEAWERRRERLD